MSGHPWLKSSAELLGLGLGSVIGTVFSDCLKLQVREERGFTYVLTGTLKF